MSSSRPPITRQKPLPPLQGAIPRSDPQSPPTSTNHQQDAPRTATQARSMLPVHLKPSPRDPLNRVRSSQETLVSQSSLNDELETLRIAKAKIGRSVGSLERLGGGGGNSNGSYPSLYRDGGGSGYENLKRYLNRDGGGGSSDVGKSSSWLASTRLSTPTSLSGHYTYGTSSNSLTHASSNYLSRFRSSSIAFSEPNLSNQESRSVFGKEKSEDEDGFTSVESVTKKGGTGLLNGCKCIKCTSLKNLETERRANRMERLRRAKEMSERGEEHEEPELEEDTHHLECEMERETDLEASSHTLDHVDSNDINPPDESVSHPTTPAPPTDKNASIDVDYSSDNLTTSHTSISLPPSHHDPIPRTPSPQPLQNPNLPSTGSLSHPLTLTQPPTTSPSPPEEEDALNAAIFKSRWDIATAPTIDPSPETPPTPVVCATCAEPLTRPPDSDPTTVKAVQGIHHRGCFRCSGPCGKALAGTLFYERGQKAFCRDCWGDIFCPRCTMCGEAIREVSSLSFLQFNLPE
ncbi:hypothetical protein HDU97_000069 [Phlyctochytrium planicorne]|nr:hypothetical protein HDU97_000069 [Phlyctochytrium planicorne]